MLFAFWILWRLRNRPHAAGWLFGVYMMLYSVERFVVEFIRAKDDRVLLDNTFTIAQAASVAILLAGAAMAWYYREPDDFDPAKLDTLKPVATERA
jgi:phosphatidylglycerol:prolipoprotein diacylglycerol transferase